MSLMSLIVALSWGLIHSIWQGLALHAGVWLIAARLRSAPQRYLLSCGAQLAWVVAFAATLLRELEAASRVPVGLAAFERAGAGWWPGLMSVTVLGWLCGLTLMLARLARGLYGLDRMRRAASLLASWRPTVEREAARLGIRRAIAICEGAVDSPLALGWLRPVIMLPLGWAAQLPAQVVEAAILHELVHIRRHDFAINVLQHVVEALFFFHPSVWWLSRQVRRERELCCDQIVADAHLDPLDYAAALVALEQQRKLGSALPEHGLSVAAARGELSARVEHILERRGQRRPQAPQRGLAGAVAALLLGSAAALGACLSSDEAAETVPVVNEVATLGEALGAPRWMPESVTRHRAAIEAAAAAHGIDPALLSVMVLVESRGNPEAVSPGGALGLMQLMPQTAARIAANRGLAAPTPAELRSPAYNLDLAASYVAELLAWFAAKPLDERVRFAALAYVGGEHMLRRHLSGQGELPTPVTEYGQLVSALWSERNAASSPTYQALAAR
jgi:beta-lactamase regulating signal transducer with metallopeptidase domain